MDIPDKAAGAAKALAWQQYYSRAPVVAAYRGAGRLQPAEATIFAALKGELAAARLLDIGVGGGRTSVYLAPQCRHYTGVDFASGMVAACRERFVGQPWFTPDSFAQADARDLPFGAGAFDIVLFSFNGLDHVPAEDRAGALAECRRVLRRGGWFVYSSHNLNWVDGRGSLPRRGGWRDWFGDHRYRRQMLRLNAAKGAIGTLQAMELAEPPEGASVYYARPAEHLRQARAAGFDGLRAYDGAGAEITTRPDMAQRRDAWLYFLGRAA